MPQLTPVSRRSRLPRPTTTTAQKAVAGFTAAIGLLELVAPRSLTRGDQEHLMQELGSQGADEAACCVHAGLKTPLMARVWHAGHGDRRASPDRTPKITADQPKSMRADDGNRTRMTSLEDHVRLPRRLHANHLVAQRIWELRRGSARHCG
jgi:hypothetical protein